MNLCLLYKDERTDTEISGAVQQRTNQKNGEKENLNFSSDSETPAGEAAARLSCGTW
jgi:hypothetical protein